MDSPPKRMTRARAAAKASEGSVKTAKIVTAAAKAKAAGPSTATAPTRSTAAKRKTRADEQDEDGDSDHNDIPARRARGRPRKDTEQNNAQSSLEPARATRTRVTKSASSEPPRDEPRARGRPRRNTATAAGRPGEAAPRRTTARSRTGTVTKSNSSTTAKAAPKKSVKFDDTDKENIEPASKKESNTKGLGSKPARRPPTPTNQTTSNSKQSDSAEKKPLSPKKVTQIPILRGREAADDEHHRDQSPSSPMKKSPARPPANSIPVTKQAASAEKDPDSTVAVNAAILNAPESTTATFGSPPRRPPQSPNRDTMKSPAKRMGNIPLPGSAVKHTSRAGDYSQDNGSQKSSMFQTPAKRPPSPIKGMTLPSSQKPQNPQDAFKASLFQSPAKRALPGLQPLSERQDTISMCETPAMKPLALSASVRMEERRPSEKLTFEDQHDGISEMLADELLANTPQASRFSGRLSEVMPRNADPIANEGGEGYNGEDEDDGVDLVQTYSFYDQQTDQKVDAADEEGQANLPEEVPEGVTLTSEEGQKKAVHEAQSTPTQTNSQNPMYQLRDKDLDPFHDMTMMSDSDDEADIRGSGHAFTPGADNGRRTTMGLSSLADQLGSWSAASPIKVDSSPAAIHGTGAHVSTLKETPDATPAAEASPVKSSYFEEEISAEQQPDAAASGAEILDPSLENVAVTNEDLALAQEADEMSCVDMRPSDAQSASRSFGDSVSEASQEYGDENQVPIDPAMTGPQQPPVTPERPAPRTVATTTKVPLKAADESSPVKKRRFSAASIQSNGTGNLPKSATVISYSPSKEKRRSSGAFDLPREPSTPGEKSDLWSSMGTPARTPRRDVNPQLLRGAVVFVDVHTSEGADASGIFVDLLSHMGARCVKTWSWNPSSSANAESSSNKIGITHVVFKDGGKRTMEKVRQSKGVVQCVGVSWVLDCERENEWLEEAPYVIDSSFVPRGGARRRKSMEPKSIANMNGTIVSTPSKGQQVTPFNRRQSSLWMHTPPDQGDASGEEDDIEWSQFILTPVPRTPAPDAVAKYAEEIGTPSMGEDDTVNMSPSKQEMLMRTCPSKANAYGQMGRGILSEQKDEQVLMRLMAARRKSLQFAPKIGSPLSKAWQ